jgi:hypothetical protein
VDDAMRPAGEGGLLVALHDLVCRLPVSRLQVFDGAAELGTAE